MAEPRFRVGDIVRLRSGGPNMTITAVVERSNPRQTVLYRCVWFDQKKHLAAEFPEVTIQPTSKPPEE